MQVKDLTMNMEADMMGQTLQMEIVQKAPHKVSTKMTTQGMTVMEQVFNGEKGIQGQMGQNAPMSAEDIELAKKQAVLFPEAQLEKTGATLKFVGTENVDGKNAYVVEMVDTDGKKTNLFFDASTFLKIKEVSTFEANGQTVTMTNDLADYKEVDGILFPHTRTTSGAMPAPLKMIVKEIKVNSGVADSFFKVE